MKKWEYDVEKYYEPEMFKEICNDRGEHGWELCGMQWYDSIVLTVWKRQVTVLTEEE